MLSNMMVHEMIDDIWVIAFVSIYYGRAQGLMI